jgi:hypothetical protein
MQGKITKEDATAVAIVSAIVRQLKIGDFVSFVGWSLRAGPERRQILACKTDTDADITVELNIEWDGVGSKSFDLREAKGCVVYRVAADSPNSKEIKFSCRYASHHGLIVDFPA